MLSTLTSGLHQINIRCPRILRPSSSQGLYSCKLAGEYTYKEPLSDGPIPARHFARAVFLATFVTGPAENYLAKIYGGSSCASAI